MTERETPRPVVADNPDKRRYEITVGGELAGFAEYVERAGRIIFVHTETDPRRHGQGLGTVLVRDALELARATGKPIVPLCPFVEHYVAGHPELDEFIDEDMLAKLSEPPAR